MRIVLIFFAFFLFPGLAAAQEPVHSPNEPIEITSERMEALSNPRRVHFSGEVMAIQADVVIYADELRVYFQDDDQSIGRIEALGRVRVVQEDRLATGEKGIFQRGEGTIVLTGNPRVRQGENFVEGDEITVFLNEERSIVRSEGGSQVRAVFHPEEEKP